MSIIRVDVRSGDRGLSREARSLVRALLMCQLAEQTGHAAKCRKRLAALAGEHDADSALDREVVEAAAARAEFAIAEAHHALVKVDDGSYGSCEHCGEAIPFERLEAIPQARFCFVCAAEHD
jgi:RNA polymerase-binding transcription factor DksA